MADYEVGDRIKIVTTFRNDVGVPTSPSSFVGEYRKPGTAIPTAVVPTDGGAGVLTIVLPTFDVGGIWSWWIAGTGGVIAADQGFIAVDPKVTA